MAALEINAASYTTEFVSALFCVCVCMSHKIHQRIIRTDHQSIHNLCMHIYRMHLYYYVYPSCTLFTCLHFLFTYFLFTQKSQIPCLTNLAHKVDSDFDSAYIHTNNMHLYKHTHTHRGRGSTAYHEWDGRGAKYLCPLDGAAAPPIQITTEQ